MVARSNFLSRNVTGGGAGAGAFPNGLRKVTVVACITVLSTFVVWHALADEDQ